jgi:nickel-dependent lactate racemase
VRVKLPFGRGHIDVSVPEDAVVVEPSDPPALADERAAVRRALATALAALPGRRPRRAVVVFPDITRPMPNRAVLPAVLAELQELGAGPGDVTLLCATGTHREASRHELEELVGPDILGGYRVLQHLAADEPAHVEVGHIEGVPILLNREWVEADLRIATGFVEPHFFAGFSGGPKGVCPGVASLSTILEAHSPARIADRRATWTVLEGNPVHDFLRAACALCPPTLSLDVTIDRRRRLTGVWVGPLPTAHREACAFVERTAVKKVDGRFDVIVSTNAGYPLDRNLYQAVKGMAAAERIVAPGGTIVMAAACEDGTPAGSAFDRILRGAEPAALLATDTPPTLDYWQAQVLARVLGTAEVHLHTTGLDDEQVAAAHLLPSPDVSDSVESAMRRIGRRARVCVLPDGPMTVATPTNAATGS